MLADSERANTAQNPAPAIKLPVRYTKIRSRTHAVGKSFRLAEGKITKEAKAVIYDADLEVVECDFAEFGKLRAEADRYTATTYGVPKSASAKQVVTQKSPALNGVDIIARDREHFHFQPGQPGILMFDFDPHGEGPQGYDLDAVASLLEGLLPGMDSAAMWLCPSVSAQVGIEGQDPPAITGGRIYLPVLDAADIPRIGALVIKLMWLNDVGFISVSKSGAMLERALSDGSVQQGERLDFIAGAEVGPGLKKLPDNSRYRPGCYFDTLAVPDLTDAQEAEYKRRVAEAKAKIKPTAEKQAKKFVKEKVTELVAKGADETKVKADMAAMMKATGDIFGTYVLCFDDLGEHTVAEVLADPERFDGQTLADPIAGPEGGRCKAEFYANHDGKPCIHSFKHGGQVYFLHRSPQEKAEKSKGGAFLLKPDASGKLVRVPESEAVLLVADRMRDSFTFDMNSGTWHTFEKTCWKPAETPAAAFKEITRLLYEGCGAVGFSGSYFNSVVSILSKADLLPLPTPPKGTIPFLNGLLVMETGELLEITPQNAPTWNIPHPYAPGVAAPNYDAWEAVATDGCPDTPKLMLAALNAILTGRADLQKLLMAIGAGGTAKSTWARLLMAAVGERNTFSTDLRNLHENRFEVAGCYGKLLTLINDSAHWGGRADVIKALTGQDPIRLERKHQQQAGSFTYGGVVLIVGNESISFNDVTSGVDRRRLVIRFDHRITPEDKTAFEARGGEAGLHAELPALINRALSLTRAEVAALFNTPPKSAARANFEAMLDANPVAEFITEHFIPWKDGELQIGANAGDGWGAWVYPVYVKWCECHSRQPLPSRTFKARLIDACGSLGVPVISTKPQNKSCIKGIAWHPVLEPGEDDQPHKHDWASRRATYWPDREDEFQRKIDIDRVEAHFAKKEEEAEKAKKAPLKTLG